MKILVTGAHFTPAAATISELKKFQGVEVVYVGRNTTMEGDDASSVESMELPKMGVKFISITAGRLQRTFTIYTILSLLKVPIGFIQALYIILTEKPQIILSFGGYVALPLVFWGWLFSIPIIIHEQTLVSGLANNLSSLFADKIAVSFEKNIKNTKMILTGNPIREEVLRVKRIQNIGNLPVILVTGGNQGSHIINSAVVKILDKLTSVARVIHVTGDNKYNDFQNLAKLQNDRYTVRKWIGDDWGEVLSKTDLVICRAGVNTLSELSLLGIPALTIPIPNLTGDEQNKNAEYFQKLGLVKIIPQSKLSPEYLLKNINYMLKNLDDLKEKAAFAKNKIILNGASRLALETVLIDK